MYSNQTCHQDVPLHHLSVYRISGQSNNPFPLCGNFHIKTKRRRKNQKKSEETNPVFESSYLGNTWHDLVEIWNVGCRRWRTSPLQKSFGFFTSSKKLHVCENCIFVLPVTGVVRQLLGPHSTL